MHGGMRHVRRQQENRVRLAMLRREAELLGLSQEDAEDVALRAYREGITVQEAIRLGCRA